MSKIDQVRAEMMTAMKQKDKPRKDALSLLLSALKNKAIDKRAELTEQEENDIVLHEMKQARETLESAPADRQDIIDECNTRLAVYSEFAPQQMDETKINGVLDEVLAELGLEAPGKQDKGRIMKALMPRVKGRADGGFVNRLVQQRLQQ